MTDEVTPGYAPQRVGRPPTARIQRPALSARDAAEHESAGIGNTVVDAEGRLVRRRSRVDDKFHINTRKVPEGWSYEWKRDKCYGQPDTDHQVNLRENHWTPVPATRHPEMMPVDWEGPISKDGMVLMERPQYLTDDARDEDLAIARDQVRVKEAQLGQTPGGTFTRDHPSVQRITRVKRSYAPMNAED